MEKHIWNRRGFLLGAAASFLPTTLLSQQQSTPSPFVYATGDFERGSDGWLPGFSDYTFSTSDNERVAEIRPLPAEIDSQRQGYFLSARNTADDLFMFLKKPVTRRDGIEPNRTYHVDFYIEVASSAPSGCAGIGGSPGGSVYLKAGASAREPVTVLEGENNVRLNVDKGGQANGGAAASVVDTVANGIPCEESEGEFVLLKRQHRHSEMVRTGDDSMLWIFVGTDSGFEGTTSLYYARIVALLTLREDA